MNVRVRLFAAPRDAAGADLLEVEVAEGATIAELRRVMVERFPQLADLLARTMFAVDTEYATDATVLSADADVACIPPVSGG